MPVVNVMLWEGRTVEQKRELAASITESVVEIGKCPRESVVVTFSDFQKSDWAEGGYLAIDKVRYPKED